MSVTAALLGALLGGALTHYLSTLRDRENRTFPDKSKTYDEFMDMVFDAFEPGSRNEDLLKRAFQIKKKLMIRASQKTLRAWARAEEIGENASHIERLAAFENVICAIRNDLGHRDTKSEPLEFFGLIIKGNERKSAIDSMKK